MSPVMLGSQAGRLPDSLAGEGTILGIFMMEQYFFGKQMESCSPGMLTPWLLLHLSSYGGVTEVMLSSEENVPQGYPPSTHTPSFPLGLIYGNWGSCPPPPDSLKTKALGVVWGSGSQAQHN